VNVKEDKGKEKGDTGRSYGSDKRRTKRKYVANFTLDEHTHVSRVASEWGWYRE